MKSPEILHREAAQRLIARKQRTTAQQLALIAKRRGESKRECERLKS